MVNDSNSYSCNLFGAEAFAVRINGLWISKIGLVLDNLITDTECQDEWKCSVTICFSNRTDSLQTCLCIVSLARWQSSHAEDCKSLYVGSIPARASKLKVSRLSPQFRQV